SRPPYTTPTATTTTTNNASTGPTGVRRRRRRGCRLRRGCSSSSSPRMERSLTPAPAMSDRRSNSQRRRGRRRRSGLAGSSPLPLLVEPPLKYEGRCKLVNHWALLTGRHTVARQLFAGRRGGHALVDRLHWDGGDPLGESRNVLDRR